MGRRDGRGRHKGTVYRAHKVTGTSDGGYGRVYIVVVF